MRNRIISSAAALGLVVAAASYAAPQAQAADLGPYVPPPAPVPVWTWTGAYAGLHVGTLDGDAEGTAVAPGDIGSQDLTADPNGVLGGIQAGYNFQFGSFVLGAEGDVSFGDIDDVIYPEMFGAFPTRIEAEMDWMATIRGRLGWAWDRTLFYATGGVAWTDLDVTADAGADGSDSDSASMFGWTVGGGVEHALTDSISMKAEYLYADFGREDLDFNFDGFEVSSDADLETHTFRVGVNWLF